MPLLLQQLGGGNEEKCRAAETLQNYGDTLIGTPAFTRLLALVDAKVDFTPLDRRLNSSQQKGEPLTDSPTPEDQPLLENVAIKTEALLAVVMSGSPEGANRLKRLLASPSATERAIAQESEAKRLAEGTWHRGKIATLKPIPKVLFGSSQITSSDYQARVINAIDTQNRAQMLDVLRSLSFGGATTLVEAVDGNIVLLQLLKATQDASRADVKFRQQRRDGLRTALLYIDSLSPERVKSYRAFIEAAAEDVDSDVAEPAGAILGLLQKS